jgi:hypothetical protein
MGLFSKETCVVCGNEAKTLGRHKLKDGSYVCGDCVKKTNICAGWNLDTLKASSVEQIRTRIKNVEIAEAENSQRISGFTATKKFGGYIWFDDNHKWFVLPKGLITSTIDGCHVYQYKELLDYELLKDGSTITKGGLGKALVGGAVFGVAGAIVGATSKKTKQVCEKLQIKITTTNSDNPLLFINLISTETKKNSMTYRLSSNIAQEILSKFHIISSELADESAVSPAQINTGTVDVAGEIKKFKELLDMGAISQEEFDKKKDQLLNL